MYSEKSVISCLLILVLTIAKSNGQQETGVFRIDDKFPQCRNSFSIEIKEQCIQSNCRSQPTLFECKALECKLKFPTNSENQKLKNKLQRLRCIKNLCVSNSSHLACKGIETCSALKNQVLGKAKFIVCISKLFPKDKLEKETQ